MPAAAAAVLRITTIRTIPQSLTKFMAVQEGLLLPMSALFTKRI